MVYPERDRISGSNGLGGSSVQDPPDMGTLWCVSSVNTGWVGDSGNWVEVLILIQIFEKQDSL